MTRAFVATAIALLLVTMRMSAHHAFAAEYDEKKLVSVSGKVTGFKWTNPHAWLYVDAKDEAGASPGGASKWGARVG